MGGDPAIRTIFDPPDRREAVQPSKPSPDVAQFSQDAIDRRRAGELVAIGVDRPYFPIHFFARQAKLLDEMWRLIGERQHPAGGVACANPLRAAGSKPSSAVEEDDQGMPVHTCPYRKRSEGVNEYISNQRIWPTPFAIAA